MMIRKVFARAVGLVAAAACLSAGLAGLPPARAAEPTATVPEYNIAAHPVPDEYQQFVLDTTRIQETQVSFNEYWYRTTTWISGKTVFFPLSQQAAVTVHNVGTWTDTSGTHAIDMTMSVQDWHGGLVLFKDGGFWFRTSGHDMPTPEPVLQAWHTTFTPVDGRDGDAWRVDFTYADTHQPVPDTFKGVTGFNDLDGGDSLLEGVELVSGFTGAYLLPHAELQAFGNNGWYGIIRDSTDDLNYGVQPLHRLAATFSGSSFVFRYSVNHTSRVDPWSTFGVPLDLAQLRVMVTTVFVDDAGKTLRPADTQTLGLGDSWHVVPPNIAGYQFTGLGKSSDALDGTVTSDNIADRTVTLTYARKTAILHYNLNGGTGIIADTTGRVDETVKITPDKPSREGYSFTGWNTKADGTGTNYAQGAGVTLPTGGLTVYAQWQASPSKLSYNANGGAGVMSDTTGVTGQSVTVQDSMFTRPGYTFTGWATKPANGTTVKPQSKVTLPAGGMTLYAQWQANPAQLLLNPNGGADDPATLNGVTGGQVSTTGHVPTREGYTLTGWNTSKDGTGVGYAPETEYTLPAGTTTWFAQWTANKAIVSYNANGGTGSMSDVETTTVATVTVAKNGFERKGYSFTGWALTPQGGVEYQPQDAFKVSRQPLVLYAVWQANPSRITYNLKGGDGVIPNTVGKVDETVKVTGKTPTRKGYTFNGWKDCKANTSYQPNSEVTLPDGGVALCAEWAANPSQVTYDPNGGTGVTNPTTGEVDETVKAAGSGFERKGYSFTGWNVKPDGSGDVMQPEDDIKLPDGGVVLYAIWAANPSQVTYNLKGGDGSIPDTKGRVDETVHITDKTPTRTGYKFVGWNTKQDGSGETIAKTVTLPDGGIQLFAQWEAVPVSETHEVEQPNVELAQTGTSTVIIAVTCGVLMAVAAALVLVRRFLQRR